MLSREDRQAAKIEGIKQEAALSRTSPGRSQVQWEVFRGRGGLTGIRIRRKIEVSEAGEGGGGVPPLATLPNDG